VIGSDKSDWADQCWDCNHRVSGLTTMACEKFPPQERLTGNLPPNLEASAAAFGGTFPSMPQPRSTPE